MSLNYPETADEQEVFNTSIEKIVDSLVRVQAEKDLVKSVCLSLKDEFGSEPAKVKKLAKHLYEDSIEGLQEEVQELTEVFLSLKKETPYYNIEDCVFTINGEVIQPVPYEEIK